MATLYEIENEILALIDPETGEITDYEAFEQLQIDREQKLENAALLIKNCEADIAAYKAEQAVFDKKIERAKTTLESVKKYLSEALGGEKEPVGDVAYRIPLLGKLDIILQFWDADDEFPPAMRVKWDTHVLAYLRYETTYYAVNCLWQRLLERMTP